MEYPNYSAGLISQSFWFVEMKKVIKLIDDGKSEEEIKKMCIDENLFGAAKEYRAKRIYGYIWNRAKRLDKTLIDLFCTSDLATQKVINLIAILRSDRLFFEFMFEVYREKNILGIPVIEDADVNIFFKNKEIQSEDIAAWTDGTKRRLRSIYFNYLTDANLLTVAIQRLVRYLAMMMSVLYHSRLLQIFLRWQEQDRTMFMVAALRRKCLCQ